MKYKITSTSFSYAEKLIEHYPVLNNFNCDDQHFGAAGHSY